MRLNSICPTKARTRLSFAAAAAVATAIVCTLAFNSENFPGHKPSKTTPWLFKLSLLFAHGPIQSMWSEGSPDLSAGPRNNNKPNVSLHASQRRVAENQSMLYSSRSLQTASFTLRNNICEGSWQRQGSKCYLYLSGMWTQAEAAEQCRAADSLGIATLATAASPGEFTAIRSAASLPNEDIWSGAVFDSVVEGESCK